MNDQNDQPAPEARRCAFFDVDGTLAEIQPRLELVFIPPPTLRPWNDCMPTGFLSP